MDLLEEIAGQIELHSVTGIQDCFDRGVSPNAVFKGRPLLEELVSEYTRSERFKLCVKVFLDNGVEWGDRPLLAVLLDDAYTLENCLIQDPALIDRVYTLRCAYTPLYKVSLMHICAEFNHVNCAEVLFKAGLSVDVPAGVDEHGFGGHTPVFHTVNQNNNQSVDMLHFLLDHKSDTKLTVPGLIWGKGYEWETLIPSVNPLSYAMMGLLPQMHRNEEVIAATVSLLLAKTYDIHYTSPNVPNAYLAK